MKNGKKIVMLLSNGFDPDPRVYNEAVALIEKEYEVTLICWDRDRGVRKPAREKIDGINVQRIGPRSKHNLGKAQVFFIILFWLSLFVRVVFRKVHTLHCHDFDTLPVGFLLGKLKGCKLVYDAHENFSEMVKFATSRFLGKMINLVESRIVKHVDLTLTVGEILGKELSVKGARNVQVVGNWKNIQDFAFGAKDLEELKRAFGIRRERELVITYITTLKGERKITELMEAVRGEENFVLILGGKGPMEEAIRGEMRKYGNIKYLGFVNPADIPRYTALSDVIFYGFATENGNSKYSAPNKLFEALAAGKAIVTGNFGEIGSVVENFGCGLVLEDYSPLTIRRALYYFLTHPDQLVQCKQNALLLGRQKYNWDRAKDALCKNYQKLFKS